MRLSICIPTHEGRGWCLKPAIDSILSQIDDERFRGEVEICISDNASTDETREVVEEAAARAPGAVLYHRFPLDVGPYNFLNSVRMASGEFCWFMGSDDLLEPDAVAHVFDTIARYPDCSGITGAHRFFNFDMTKIEPGHPRSYYPSDYDRERRFTTFRDALVALGLAHTFMSVQIFRRAIWNEIVAGEPPEFTLYSRYHLHAYLLGMILLRDPRWVWSPTSIVRMRGGNADVVARTGVISYGHALAVLRDMDSIWSRVCGDDRATYGAIMTKGLRTTWSPSVVRHTKMLPYHRTRDDFGMLFGFSRYLARVPAFWSGTFWALLVPHWFWKGLIGSGAMTGAKKLMRRSAG
jgi:glycosyltransferase involved in cell wall biosynthesis